MKFNFRHGLLLFTSTTLLFTSGCKKEADSETSALTNQNLACFDYSPAQYQQLQSAVNSAPGFFNNFATNDQNALLKHLQAIPPLYRNQLIALKKNGTFRGFFKRDLGGGGVMGVCSSTNKGPREIALTNRYGNSISFAMIHEVGHGVEGMIQSKAQMSNRDWEAKLKDLMNEAAKYNNKGGISGSQQVRDYAFASDAEFFAEVFHNYYCSPTTHAFIQKNLPRTYAFASTVLEKPVFTGNNGTPTTPMPPAPDNDTGEELAQKHMDEIVKAYNGKSKSCNIYTQNISRVEANGDFVVDISALTVKGQKLPAVRLRTNYKLSLNNELADLKAIIPKIFQGCPGE